jgi:hypothetical protein
MIRAYAANRDRFEGHPCILLSLRRENDTLFNTIRK